jgi:8-oxo-dGTP diphosphatase
MTTAQEPRRTVLCFVFDRKLDKLLMIHKKRGQGAGKWNVPGGKIIAGESEAEAAARECFEETGILPADLREAGRLDFRFPEGNSWNNTCTVFTAEKYSGALVEETEECSSEWISLSTLPVDKMWDSDRLWLPLLLSGKPFHRVYIFDAVDKVKEEQVLY